MSWSMVFLAGSYVCLIVVQTQHLARDFFMSPLANHFMAASIIIGLSAGYGAAMTVWAGNDNRKRALALIPVACFVMGSVMSVQASYRVFSSGKHKQMEWERLGVEGQAIQNELVRSGEALNEGGGNTQVALNRQQNALASLQAFKQRNQGVNGKSASEKALLGDSDKSTDKAVESMAWFQASTLEAITHGIGMMVFLMGANIVRSHIAKKQPGARSR